MLANSGMFVPHHNLSDQVNGNIIQSEIEGGVYLNELPEQSTIEVVTQNRGYTLVVRRDGQAMISGHPEFCPEPVLVRIRPHSSAAACISNIATPNSAAPSSPPRSSIFA